MRVVTSIISMCLLSYNSVWSLGESEDEYLEKGKPGPTYWPILFPNYCAGSSQSPINILTQHTVLHNSLTELTLSVSPNPGNTFNLQNNGHTVKVDVVGDYEVTDGGLVARYKTAEFHFHWGKDSLRGSEHQVDGQSDPIEMHIVNWNVDEYNSIGEALTQPDGLAVLGILFTVSTEDNPDLQSVIQALSSVRDPDEDVKISIPAVPLDNFLPSSPDRYFRYKGSLTTPSCDESVIWTVFEQKQTISERQLAKFRRLLVSSDHTEDSESADDGEALVDNFRPVQDLNGRTVYRSF